MEKIMTCKKCGIMFKAKHANKKYCKFCDKATGYERKKRHQQSDKGKQRSKDRYNNEGGKEYMRTPKRKEFLLKKRYGITLEQRNDMLKNQGIKCVICGKVFETDRDVCIDHNHASGAVRAILCRNCNAGLGCFKESIEIMGKAQDYILKHNGF